MWSILGRLLSLFTNVEEAAKAAYMADAANSEMPWEELPEWVREAWRCEVDKHRDPENIVRLARYDTQEKVRNGE